MTKIKNSTILYVEDDTITRENISLFLATKCRKLYIASNGEEAYTSFLNNDPDIIITDIQMPLLNGLDMAEKIKKISPKTQIIITSAYSQQEYLLKAVNLHLVQYIIKPLSIIKLNSALKDCEHFIEEKKDDKVFLKKEIFYDKIKKRKSFIRTINYKVSKFYIL
ncbi:MAG: response regulator [Campylobacteraceae bacterium]|nr:response regulator [Campylobacteraceae bacterium]